MDQTISDFFWLASLLVIALPRLQYAASRMKNARLAGSHLASSNNKEQEAPRQFNTKIIFIHLIATAKS
jgi:hypothetical protein